MPSTPAATPGFDTLGLDPRIVAALSALGYEEPTPIQAAAIPLQLAGHDILAQAATGTGKTAAFALPLLHRLHPDAPVKTRTAALVLVPTRELAMQVAEAIHKYGKAMQVVALPIYGGAAMDTQIRALKRGVDVVIATPGRALDHIRRGTLQLSGVRTVVLDEADEMLDMGFAEDLEAILNATPAERQTALFSATVAPRIATIAAKHLRSPQRVTIEKPRVAAGQAAKVRQVAYIVPRAHKMAALGRVLDIEQPVSAIVFCRTRTEVDELTETLNARGYRADALHGGLSQDARDRVMRKFRSNKSDLLVATDVAARGLDVQHVSHVVNYDVPTSTEAYVHRIGRTGRAGREGAAITLAEPREHRLLRNVEAATKTRIEIATVPTVADLRARRLELTRAGVREAILAGDLDAVRPIVESLAGEFSVMDVAAGAIKLLEAQRGADSDQKEIPSVEARPPRRDAGGTERPARERAPRPRDGGPFERPAREASTRPPRAETAPRATPSRKEMPWEVATIYVGAGRFARVRPSDLVGAIANEVGIDSSAVGAIQIADKYSLVEVPDEIADEIIAVLRGTTIKGKRVVVRRERTR